MTPLVFGLVGLFPQEAQVSPHAPETGALSSEAGIAVADGTAEPASFAELFRLHFDRAYRFAYRLAGDAHDAEDLVQQAAEEAFRAFHQFRPGTRFDRWFMRILHNSFLDEMRRRRRHPNISVESISPNTLIADARSDPVAVAEGTLGEQAQRVIKALPIGYRAPVVLVDLMDMTYEEAAEVLHCPVGTIRSRLHRGRLAIRRSLRSFEHA